MKYLHAVLIFLLGQQLMAQDEATRAAWEQAKSYANDYQYAAAKPYLLTVLKEMPRPLCCYWLGVVYDIENKVDSAEYYYKKCLANSRKPQLRAWDNLARLYMRQMNLEKAYKMCWDGITQYPGNLTVLDQFKEVCLWSYCLKHRELNKTYLTDWNLKKSYKVATITEQYLIVKNIRDQRDQHLHVSNRGYKGTTEIWTCSYNGSKKKHSITFVLKDHKLDRALDAMHANAREVYNDKNESMPVRLGALLALTPLTDKMLIDVLASESEEIRLCTCSEVTTSSAKKIKKQCLKDSSEKIRNLCEKLDVYSK